jgi:hypothetical protein
VSLSFRNSGVRGTFASSLSHRSSYGVKSIGPIHAWSFFLAAQFTYAELFCHRIATGRVKTGQYQAGRAPAAIAQNPNKTAQNGTSQDGAGSSH